MELSNSNIKKFLIFQETKTPKKLLRFSQKKAFLIFREMEAPKKFLIIQETETSKKLQEVTFQVQKMKKTYS